MMPAAQDRHTSRCATQLVRRRLYGIGFQINHHVPEGVVSRERLKESKMETAAAD